MFTYPPARRTCTALALATLVMGCGGDSATPVDVDPPVARPTTLTVAGDAQRAPAGEAVPVAPSVTVRDAQGRPMAGITVTFAVAAGGGVLEGGSPVTNAAGVAAVSRWTLGASGAQRLSARVGSLPPVEVSATIEPGTEFFTADVGTGGGTLTISDSGHPYEGLTLTIPADMYEGTTSWRLETGELAGSFAVPSGFTVAGPPLVLTTAALRGEKLMTLEVPVAPDTPEALAFIALHDPVRGVSELLPTLSRTATSVTVATGHLRGDLLQGPVPETSAGGAPPLTNITIPTPTHIIPLLMEELSTVEATLNRWPVADHGTATHPDGVGIGITALQGLAALSSMGPFSEFVKPLSIPGFYAEAGPLAAAQISQNIMKAQISAALANLSTLVGQQSAAERERRVLEDIIASMRFSRRPAMLAFMSEALEGPGAVSVTSAGPSLLTMLHPAITAPQQVTIDAGRFGTFTLPLVAGGSAQQVSRLAPLSSAFVSFSPLEGVLSSLRQLSVALTPEDREQINRSLAAQAGLGAIQAQIRHGAVAAFVNASLERLVARRTTAQLRVLGHSFTLHLPDGAELARSTEDPVSMVDDAAVPTGGSVQEVFRTISTHVQGLNGLLQQLSVTTARMAYAPFEVGPEETLLSVQDRTVELEASVPLPPEEGYRIEWLWGDGEQTEHLGLANASHSYQQSGEYEVVARLLSVTDRVELAVDTVQVREKPSMWIGSVTATLSNTNPNFANTVYMSATGLRFERDSASGTETARYNLTQGTLTLYNDVPCAGYVSPTVVKNLATQTPRPWILTNSVDPLAPAEGTPARGLWFLAHGFANGFQVYNKVCPTDQNPEPEAYVYATGFAWLFTYRSSQPATGWRRAPNPDVLEGTYVDIESSTVTKTYTWRFERVDAP